MVIFSDTVRARAPALAEETNTSAQRVPPTSVFQSTTRSVAAVLGCVEPSPQIDEDVGMAEEPFVPSGFVAPLAPATEQFRLEPLGPQHNDSDYEAWSSSLEHIHATPGWEKSNWPDDRSKEDNLRDLQGHASDFEKRAGFTYTVLDPATGDVIGCVYIYPDKSKQHDARVLSWVRASRAELDGPLWRSVADWLTDEWPFESADYAERPGA
jgi:hypothetical protein